MAKRDDDMLKVHLDLGGRLGPAAGLDDPGTIWTDLFCPTEEERATVAGRLGLPVPTREEMEEIEASARLYQDGDALVMTIMVPANTDGPTPGIAPVTFVLGGGRLVTVRHHDPRAFQIFASRPMPVVALPIDGGDVLVALLQAIVERMADVLERVGSEVDGLSRRILQNDTGRGSRARDFQDVLRRLGHQGDLLSKVAHSLMTLQRLTGFLTNALMQRRSGKPIRDAVKTLGRDVASLDDHTSFVSEKVGFLMEATLGMIGIEQNAIIKIFSVAAVVFLPPTLIASIYGMNFSHMEELHWQYGYPLALLAMVVSAVLPYLFFRLRGWL